MIIGKRIKGAAVAAFLGPTGQRARQALASARRTLTKQAPVLDFYFDVADPWSYLAAQALQRIVDAYPIEFTITIVLPPASDVNPFPAMRSKYAMADARELARYYDVVFPGKREADPGSVKRVAQTLIMPRPPREQLRCILEMVDPMWRNDNKTLAVLQGTWGFESAGGILPALSTNYTKLRAAGHYLGGALHFGGAWFWGIDRVECLEAALAAHLGVPVKHVLGRRASGDASGGAGSGHTDEMALGKDPLGCELWFSFRSPYSYLAIEQLPAILAPHGVPLTLRPVAPMVERGVKLPMAKQLYILVDAKREADRAGLAFGNICDPLGTAVANCISITKWATPQGKALAFVQSAMRGIWTEAKDLAEYVDLRAVVERAGLDWEGAKAATEDQAAAARWAKDNATDLTTFGLWGVPTVRVGDLALWGQDRLPLLAARLREHDARPPAPPVVVAT